MQVHGGSVALMIGAHVWNMQLFSGDAVAEAGATFLQRVSSAFNSFSVSSSMVSTKTSAIMFIISALNLQTLMSSAPSLCSVHKSPLQAEATLDPLHLPWAPMSEYHAPFVLNRLISNCYRQQAEVLQ
jgi:hypothetical protein